jgi:hypothetical protein
VIEHLSTPDVQSGHDKYQISTNISAIRFWDKLRLSPVSGPKNIMFLAFSPLPNLVDRIQRFVFELSTVWDVCNFGTFKSCIDVPESGDEGVIPIPLSGNYIFISSCYYLLNTSYRS